MIIRRRIPRAAWQSLLLATMVALLVFVVIRATAPEDDPLPPAQVERRWTYVCPRKHKSVMLLQDAPQVCPTCGVSAFPQAEYSCTIHGVYAASLRFSRNDAGVLVVSELRLAGQEWVPVERGLVCPQCKLKLQRVHDDPLKARKPRTP